MALSRQDVTVDHALPGAAGSPGHGIQATHGATLELPGCHSHDNAGTGVLSSSVGQVAIVDPLFLKDPRGAGSTVGIIDPLFVPGPDDAAVGALRMVATDVHDNGKFGVASYGTVGSVQRAAIRGTTAGSGDFADTKVEIGAERSLNGLDGLWAQGVNTSVHVSSTARLASNSLVGVAVTAGATLNVESARIGSIVSRSDLAASGGTQPTDIGDGIGVFGKAHGRVTGAVLEGNARAAVIGHDCAWKADGSADLDVTACTITGGKFGVVISGVYGNAATGTHKSEDKNACNDVGTSETAVKDMPVQDSPCGDAGVVRRRRRFLRPFVPTPRVR